MKSAVVLALGAINPALAGNARAQQDSLPVPVYDSASQSPEMLGGEQSSRSRQYMQQPMRNGMQPENTSHYPLAAPGFVETQPLPPQPPLFETVASSPYQDQSRSQPCDGRAYPRPLQCDELQAPPRPIQAPAGGPPPGPRKSIHHVFIQQPSQSCPCPSPAQAAVQAPPLPARPAGAFVAPPQSGAVVQEQSSVGIRGMRFRFPALTLEMPSIEFPSILRRGRGAHMELDSATAPYVAGAGVTAASMQYAAMPQAAQFASYTGMPASAQQAAGTQAPPPAESARGPAPAQAAPPQAADQVSESEAALQCEFERLQQRCARIEQLLDRLISCQPPIQAAPPQPLCPPPEMMQQPCPPPHRR